jgi:hypothetical protein
MEAAGMTADTIVTVRDTAVMYVAGDTGTPIAEQAPKAFEELEAKLSSLKGRKFYGVILGDEYRACVAMNLEDDPLSLPHPTWTLPGGKYVRRRVPRWEENLHTIGQTCEMLRRRADFDPSRPVIEYYRSQRELLLMVPVR